MSLKYNREQAARIRKKRIKYRVSGHPKYIETPKPCSCMMCGNKRKWEGDTIQELKEKERVKNE